MAWYKIKIINFVNNEQKPPPTRPPKKAPDLNLFDTVDPWNATEIQGLDDTDYVAK
ncbi:MAG: hypothetical protein V4560_15055 [Bacteroidota bacterium]